MLYVLLYAYWRDMLLQPQRVRLKRPSVSDKLRRALVVDEHAECQTVFLYRLAMRRLHLGHAAHRESMRIPRQK